MNLLDADREANEMIAPNHVVVYGSKRNEMYSFKMAMNKRWKTSETEYVLFFLILERIFRQMKKKLFC